MTESEQGQEQARPSNEILIFTSFGERTLGAYLAELGETEVTLGTTGLKPHDLLAMGYQRDTESPQNFLFAIDRVEWKNLGISNTIPTTEVFGRLEGIDIPPQVGNTEVRFLGSGFGGSQVQLDTLATQRSPYFRLADGSEFIAPVVNKLELFRPDDDGIMQPMTTPEATTEQNAVHHERLTLVRQLMDTFGFDVQAIDAFLANHPSKPLADEDLARFQALTNFENDRYAAFYRPDDSIPAHHAYSLNIYDKETRQFMRVKHFDAPNDNLLQICLARLQEGTQPDQVRAMTDADLHIARIPMITYTSASSNDLIAITYKTGRNEIPELVGSNGDKIVEVNILPHQPPQIVPHLNMMRDHGDYQRIVDTLTSSISIEAAGGTTNVLKLGSKEVRLSNPNASLTEILSGIQRPGEVKQRFKPFASLRRLRRRK